MSYTSSHDILPFCLYRTTTLTTPSTKNTDQKDQVRRRAARKRHNMVHITRHLAAGGGTSLSRTSAGA